MNKPLYAIFNNKSNSKKSINNLKQSLNHLNILIRETLEDGLAKFKNQLEKLQELMISLFPEGEGFQLSLFDVESYIDNRQPRVFKSFLDWLDSLKYRFCGQANIESRVEAKTVKVQQLSICFGA